MEQLNRNAISIHALREEGDLFLRCSGGGVLSISIHALREEGDRTGLTLSVIISNFYPRPPRGGRRPRSDRCCPAMRFLSTPSARRATDGRYRCGRAKHISIHALREEGDLGIKTGGGVLVISIHALREEGDDTGARLHGRGKNFYPRPPRGGRQAFACWLAGCETFLSTPSARRATSRSWFAVCRLIYFYPRPPRGGRRLLSVVGMATVLFLSTPSARRATGAVGLDLGVIDFYPRPPRGGRREPS